MDHTPKRMLITAGPTHEPIDPVRYLGNRSSGRMGVAMAAAALEYGWAVTLLLGPIAKSPIDLLEHPPATWDQVDIHRYQSTAELQALLARHFPQCDVLIMAAAVADYRPKHHHSGKVQREAGGMTLELEPTPDLVAECARGKRADQRIMAFALEQPDHLLERAAAKMQRKAVDAIIANPLEAMDAPDIAATLIPATGEPLPLPQQDKSHTAHRIMHWIGQWWAT